MKSKNNFRNIQKFYLLPIGFLFIGFASMFEMFDHFKTAWIYINHSSLFNWLFYSSLAIGLTLLSVSVIKNKFIITFCSLLCMASICAYWPMGKSSTVFFQILTSTFLIINWQNRFKDYLLVAYPIFGILLTTIFGINLVSTNNQIWHIFIGPSGSISVLTFYFILKRSSRKLCDIR
tara:strand:- start:19669 stop:20199 length:531 start_codon:yes stop_codon:yes gene_type:complete